MIWDLSDSQGFGTTPNGSRLGPAEKRSDRSDMPRSELKTGGIFEYVRHPIYGGLLLLCFGAAIVSNRSSAELRWGGMEVRDVSTKRLQAKNYKNAILGVFVQCSRPCGMGDDRCGAYQHVAARCIENAELLGRCAEIFFSGSDRPGVGELRCNVVLAGAMCQALCSSSCKSHLHMIFEKWGFPSYLDSFMS